MESLWAVHPEPFRLQKSSTRHAPSVTLHSQQNQECKYYIIVTEISTKFTLSEAKTTDTTSSRQVTLYWHMNYDLTFSLGTFFFMLVYHVMDSGPMHEFHSSGTLSSNSIPFHLIPWCQAVSYFNKYDFLACPMATPAIFNCPYSVLPLSSWPILLFCSLD